MTGQPLTLRDWALLILRIGTGWELDILLLCIAAALTLVGAGALSLDAALRSRRPT